MKHGLLDRTLWHQDEHGRKIEVAQQRLVDFAEPVVVLGEAGMGKSSLLGELGKLPGYAGCTARQLINRADPRSLLGDATTLVIDALDEVSTSREGDAVDAVLRRLGEIGCPRFVLSCRSIDWRSATGAQAIEEQYERAPLQLHLEPLTDAQVLAFLGDRIGPDRAEAAARHFQSLGLDGLLGNPQSLSMIADVVAGSDLPKTRDELFSLAITKLVDEHNDAKPVQRLPREARLAGAGAACAALILTGHEALARRAAANLEDGDLALAELDRLPDGEHACVALASRLFKAAGDERFGYVHRRIGEDLGARWLAAQADTPRKRRRLLALFHHQGLVPSSLRGMHAWLAQSPALAPAVIAADPMGVIEYGDVAALDTTQVRGLLESLRKLALIDPHLNQWRAFAVPGVARMELLDELRCAVASEPEPFGFRLIVLKSLARTPAAAAMAATLQSLVVNGDGYFALRRAAAQALADVLTPAAWRDIALTLLDQDSEDSTRLALEIMPMVDYAPFEDELIVDIAIAAVRRNRRLASVLYELEHRLPDERIASVLERLAVALPEPRGAHDYDARLPLNDLVYHLIARQLVVSRPSAETLLRWLQPVGSDDGYDREPRIALQQHLIAETALRRDVQSLALLDGTGEDHALLRHTQLIQYSLGLECSEDDVVALLERYSPRDEQDPRWRELLQLIPHGPDKGNRARATAQRFAADDPEAREWIERLGQPVAMPLDQRREQRKEQQRVERAERHAQHREHFAQRVEPMRAGAPADLTSPASAYLGIYHDLDKDLPAPERLQQWLGPDLAQAALLGFQAFLLAPEHARDRHAIERDLFEDSGYPAAQVLIAGLAERHRLAIGLDDLPDDILFAGFVELHRNGSQVRYGLAELQQAVVDALRARSLWAEALRIACEPQLRAGHEYVLGLTGLLNGEEDPELIDRLAAEWLHRFESLPWRIEEALIERLLKRGQREPLKDLVQRAAVDVPSDRSQTWDAIDLIVDFEAAAARLDATGMNPGLLFEIRDRSFEDRGARDPGTVIWSPAQLEWIVSRFRGLWPVVPLPEDGWVGDRNPWDAVVYLRDQIRRLGNDTSDAARAALARLCEAPADDYSETLRSVRTEQQRTHVESHYAPPELEVLAQVANDKTPNSAADLQAWLLEELVEVQKKIRSDDAESWRGFYDSEEPRNEEQCRDHLMGLLRQGTPGVEYAPEGHVAADKEVDIACSAGKLRLPIEIKGQWNRQLWTGADEQLDRLYTSDWRADGRGIYLLLWFGEQDTASKRLVGPGKGSPLPATPEQARQLLIERSAAAREGRVEVVVLDVSRPAAIAAKPKGSR
ncbi:hypothetical protein RDV84_17960 [Lysobacter yananisis]|uniref:ATP-binding protein n=1 Tax=Lysobacter yananisis TaxID=1003114 RepID=A0ABY9P7L2_9GAMM|nr:hypothetical protein [Lysobacter yananisis]WMT01842.1 hypothetical protein RDV84_17960 [Lysobacter yananisis]